MRRLPDTIVGIGEPSKRVSRNPQFEPRSHAGLGPGHFELWNRIGPGVSVADLIERSSLETDQAIAHLEQLILLQAVQVTDEAAPAPDEDASAFEIVDATELGQVTPEEQALLREEVDLATWEKRHIIAAARLVRSGDYFELLGISPGSTKIELKRAYFQLSKEFHPDRYYGKNLGTFGPLLSRIFETAAETVRSLAAQSIGPSGPRRRTGERYACKLRTTVRCASWSDPIELFAQDVSDRGLFVVTTHEARRGDRVEVEIRGGRLGPLQLQGRVVNSRSPDAARRTGRRPGIAIELGPVVDERWALVLDRARRSAEVPVVAPSSHQPEPAPTRTRLARGTGSHRQPSTVLGIDFGTTYTSISVAIDGKVVLIPLEEDARATPSVVSFPSASQILVGEAARKRLLVDPAHTVSSVKRLLGVAYDDRNVQGLLGPAAYRTAATPDGRIGIDMRGERYAAPQLVGAILRHARDRAERYLQSTVEQAVLTVPVTFGQARVDALRRAARLAQLEVVDIIDEPTAAAYANRDDPQFEGLVGVYDFGGGTFDFSVVDTSAGDIRVLGTSGDSWLGGDDFDVAIANAAANHVWKAHGIDLRTRAVEWQRLLFSCEQAKRLLSLEERAMLFVPEALRSRTGASDLRIRLDRRTCERLWEPLMQRSLEVVKHGLQRAGIAPSRLTAICLSGGTSYIPAVRQRLREHLNVPVRIGTPPEYAACFGAGVYAAKLERYLAPRLAPR